MSAALARIIPIVGGPGTGKGTQCNKLINAFSFCVTLSAGQCMRDEKATGSDLGKRIAEYDDRGELLPGEIVLEVLDPILSDFASDPSTVILLDGFPRTTDNVNKFRDYLAKKKDTFTCPVAVDLAAPDATIEFRLLSRGKSGSGRYDDQNVDIVRQRIKNYHDRTAPMLDIMRTFVDVITIDTSDGNLDEVTEDILAALRAAGVLPPRLTVVPVVGAPGTGKGTQCSKLVESGLAEFVHVSSGQLMRDERDSGSELGAQIQEYDGKGELLPGDIVLAVLDKGLEQIALSSKKKVTVLLDGFPRSVENVHSFLDLLDRKGASWTVPGVLNLTCPDKVLEERILARGADGSGRWDDQDVSVVRTRLSNFHRKTQPILHTLKSHGFAVVDVSTNADVERVFTNVVNACRHSGILEHEEREYRDMHSAEVVVEFESEGGEKVVGNFCFPNEEVRPRPTVLIFHGFMSFRHGGEINGSVPTERFFQRMARWLAEDGVCSLRIDFRGSGDSDGEWRDTTLHSQIADAHAALDFLFESEDETIRANVDTAAISALGHSLGAVSVSALCGQRPACIHSAILLNPAINPYASFALVFGAEKFHEALTLPYAGAELTYSLYGEPETTLRRTFFDSLLHVDPLTELSRHYGDLLVVVGDEDPDRPDEEYGRLAASHYGGSARVVTLHTDHRFGYWKHYEMANACIDAVVDFMTT